ncbi:hypothetical protein SAMN06295879_3280 [Agreia bicolorata]|uniref:Uncharacterized protein n=1 Tax=Agreia bicolorata TaxID=110935 RepID=A0A1T4YJX9_9MICO|nr:hypothetical protein [Agreia bicolorata]SKB01575.1 hypothetical protein SAMN06295879_3280 [Agreia bicolorata]
MTKSNANALKKLMSALEKHSNVANADKSSVKQIERATSRVREAATLYLSSLPAKKAMPNPFLDVRDDRLDDETRATLASEWNQAVQRIRDKAEQ